MISTSIRSHTHAANSPLARMLFAREKYDGGMHDAEVDPGVLRLATCLNLPFNVLMA